MASIDASRAGAQILPFYLAGETGEAALVRGRFATVGVPVTQILARHGYPDAVAGLQAEAMAIAACLSTFMKFDGVFTLQAKGDAYVKTLLADVTSDGALRGYTAFDDEMSPPVGDDMVAAMPASVPALLGTGYVAFTVDQQQYLQGYLPVVLMYLEATNANQAGGGLPVLTGPGFVTPNNAAAVKELSAAGTR